MTKTEFLFRGIASFCVVALTGTLTGCICPPCAQGAGAPAAPGAAGGEPSAEGTASAAPAAGGVVWDGDSVTGNAQGWADCDQKPDCTGTLEAQPAVGHEGSSGLKFHGEGAGWIGMGWNWFGWYPEDGGTDISGYKNLTLWLKIEGKTKELAPDLGGTSISLGSSNKKNSANATLNQYGKDALDGQWHKITIPVAELTKGEGKEFDPKRAWELRIGTWSSSPKAFDIYVDRIAFEN